MIDQFRTVYRGGTGEIVEKKSRFISTVRLVESEEEALSCLEALRKKYWVARHHNKHIAEACSLYHIEHRPPCRAGRLPVVAAAHRLLIFSNNIHKTVMPRIPVFFPAWKLLPFLHIFLLNTLNMRNNIVFPF